MKIALPLLFLLFSPFALRAQAYLDKIDPDLLHQTWDARWIFHPESSGTGYGVYHFRKTFDLDETPDEFLVHVSADNRYRLLVNGEQVSIGPARGDLLNWRYETVDLASFLKSGENVLSAVVWNFGEMRPLAQHTMRTAFVMQGNSEREHIVNTDDNTGWKVIENLAYKGLPVTHLRTYYVVGPGDEVDGSQYPWGWETLDYDDDEWATPGKIHNPAVPRGIYDYAGNSGWNLVPRNIPMLEETRYEDLELVRSEGLRLKSAKGKIKFPITIPANTEAALLFDHGELTIGYPELVLSGGEDSSIKASYGEALFDSERRKGNRNEIEGKQLIGNFDIFHTDGGDKRLFRPLWYRTFRYLQLDISTKDKPLRIESLAQIFSAYPFEENATFESGSPMLSKIWDASWRTIRLCSTETYSDCPYYEQLQYVGDTRIQALISLYVSGDDRLMRNALLQFDQSRVPDGLTASRYPSYLIQMTPPYSLIWVLMVHDYYMLRPDAAFTEQFHMGIENVLTWFENHVDESGLLGRLEWPAYMDAAPGFGPAGSPPSAENGQSAQVTLLYAYTLDHAAYLFEQHGKTAKANAYREDAKRLKQKVVELCYDTDRKLFAETPEKIAWTQHTNVLAILTDTVAEADQAALMERILADETLIPTQLYFSFYLYQAMKKVGFADQYLEQLGRWEQMIDQGLSTFAEHALEGRSDCHAWSSHPMFDLLATVCGIESASPGFATVRIKPHLGKLKELEASMPHPLGTISVSYSRSGENGLKAEIDLPTGLTGSFNWNGDIAQLSEGPNSLEFLD